MLLKNFGEDASIEVVHEKDTNGTVTISLTKPSREIVSIYLSRSEAKAFAVAVQEESNFTA